jgi:ApbE superfamily uncharacterized protein (UPF0280 family)
MFFLLLLVLLAGSARADAVAVFSPTGPDAAAYGAAEGYPVHAIGPQRQQRYLAGAFSHADQLLAHCDGPGVARALGRAGAPGKVAGPAGHLDSASRATHPN